jgi:hypothetical protein
MRRATIILVAVAVVAAVVIVFAAKPELLAHLGIGSDTAKLRQISRSFLEDIQFKDFKKAAVYHPPAERKTVDIPYLIERLFMLKPELLDIMEYEIVFAKVDSSGLRGRVKSRIKIKELVREKIKQRELMLYYYRANDQAPWYMRLETSLRKLDADKKKKH